MTTKIKNIAKGDLYALLSVCTKEDLDPLVKCFIGKWSNWLVIHEDYKHYSPDHTKYHRVIADEIRLYGGNTFRNLTRGGEGPSYDTVVLDVCKKLDVPCRVGETVKNEDNLLTLFLERQWSALNEEERRKIVDEARADAAKETGFNTKNVIREGGELLLTRAVAGPIGWSTAIFRAADPADSVTVPCVLHIAYLRKKHLEAARAAPAQKTDAKMETAPTVPPSAGSAALMIGTSEASPVLSLARIPEPETADWNPVNDSDGIGRLNALLHSVPSLATAGEVSTGQYMEVVIDGPLLQAKGQEGYRLITMIDGKPSHGTLLAPERLSAIVNTSALLQVASVAVAQKHMADISRKLSEIKAGIDRIRSFQENERGAVVKGATRYFEQVAQAVLSGELAGSVRHQIEHHEARLLQGQEHLLVDIRAESQQTLNVTDETLFGSKGMEDAIQEHQQRLQNLYQQLLLCIRTRACGWQLLAAYPGEERLKTTRKRSIKEALELLAENGDLLSGTDHLMRKKVQSMSALFNRNVIVNQRKLDLLAWGDRLIGEVSQRREQIAEDLLTAEAALAQQPQAVTLLAKIENEQIVATWPA
ncbi:MAG: hypothetical protein AXW13_00155 [Alcanivorax sp. Nap_24]|jgi:uncharacterized protein YaaW (UPF0174 family)|nr:MAG: hypothetical protein AXW13_00155 [Alcanivorax sp. Nap_24]